MRNDLGPGNYAHIHVTLMPYIGPSEELKTKPTKHSVAELRGRGIHPDVIVVRSDRPLDEAASRKISLFCDVDNDAVINATNVSNIYAVPLALHERGLDDVVCRHLGIEASEPDLASWRAMVDRMDNATEEVTVGIVGLGYVGLPLIRAFIGAGYRTLGFDVDQAKVDRLAAGK